MPYHLFSKVYVAHVVHVRLSAQRRADSTASLVSFDHPPESAQFSMLFASSEANAKCRNILVSA